MVTGMGTYVNTATVFVGSLIGLGVGRRFPERFRRTITHCLALVTFFLSVRMMIVIDTGYILHVVVALLVGAIVGELLKIEQGIEWMGEQLRRRFAAQGPGDQATFVEGFVVAGLIFCVGPMTLLGTFEDARGEIPNLLLIKSAMDGVLAIALAASYGRGVLFSSFFVLVFQGLMTLAAYAAGAGQIPELYIHGIRATGGVMILAIGLLLLDVVRIRVANLLPAAPLVCLILWLCPKPI
ncbi:MAG: DUF554 domain-containing protein [Planctomycetes bacterium]|nr:DUF554 domain-containing protein [Planctomycetota bacterium]